MDPNYIIRADRELEPEERNFTLAHRNEINMRVRNATMYRRGRDEDLFHYKMRILYHWWYMDHLFADLCERWDKEIGRRTELREKLRLATERKAAERRRLAIRQREAEEVEFAKREMDAVRKRIAQRLRYASFPSHDYSPPTSHGPPRNHDKSHEELSQEIDEAERQISKEKHGDWMERVKVIDEKIAKIRKRLESYKSPSESNERSFEVNGPAQEDIQGGVPSEEEPRRKATPFPSPAKESRKRKAAEVAKERTKKNLKSSSSEEDVEEDNDDDFNCYSYDERRDREGVPKSH